MSLFKNADGVYEADIRMVTLPRLHLSMRTRAKSVADPRYQAVKRLFREAKGPEAASRLALIDQLKTGALSIERLESMVREGVVLAPELPAVADASPWATVDATIERYLTWIKLNPTRRKATWEAAGAQLRRFSAFVVDGVRIGDRRLDQVTSAHVEAYQQSLIESHAAANTITGYVSRIGGLFAWVQRRENRDAGETRRVSLLLHNPFDRETAHRETSRRDRWLTQEEAERLFAATPDQLRFAVAAGLFGGLRAGEVLHLRTYVDVDLELGTITIAAKQIGVDRDGAPVRWRPKTRNSARVIPIAPDLLPILERHVASYASDDWLMPAIGEPSKPFSYATFLREFTQVVKDAELVTGRKDPRGVIFHTLRHTFASWLVMAGVDLYTVAQLLGDTLQMVERTYAHLAPDFKRRAIEALKGSMALPAGISKTATAIATTEAE